MATQRPRVAVVGGGITGAMAALALSEIADVHVFDQGRRGPGGRASHRAVEAESGAVVQDDPPIAAGALEFDHGCQFTRADDPRMKSLIQSWMAQGWVAEWNGRFGSVGGGGGGKHPPDFFGLPSHGAPVYVGVGGMHTLPRRILSGCSAIVHRGVRVAGMERDTSSGLWTLLGVGGEAAFHDSSESTAKAAQAQALTGEPFAAVVLTDISSSFGGWHRASAGVPEAFTSQVRDRCRIPLFSAMVAFDRPLGVGLDGFTCAADGSPLWFAARSSTARW